MFDIVSSTIDANALRRDLQHPAAGGLVVFEGMVRDHNEGRPVSALEYEIFEPMAVREAALIFAEARERFDVIALRGAHRAGRLEIGELAVWVGASARHRDDAFRACRYLIDEIKLRLPVWKKEHYLDGPAAWVDCQGCAHHHAPPFGEDEYYSRQLRLPDFGVSAQARLRAARVLVVGAGGLGCPAAAALAGAGTGLLTICDGDRLAASNLPRQTLYRSEDIGGLKAELLAAHLRALNPFITVTARPKPVIAADVAGLVADHDLVLDCTDNFTTRFLLHDACYLARRPLVQAGVYQHEGQVQVFDFRAAAVMAGCLRCAWPTLPEAGCVDSCAESGVLGTVPAVLGALQASEAVRLLAGQSSAASDATVLVDLASLAMTRVRRPRADQCPLCGSAPLITSLVAENYRERGPFDIGRDEFRTLAPAGVEVDITAACDLARIRELAGGAGVLVGCRRGRDSRRLVKELRAAGLARIWSLDTEIDIETDLHTGTDNETL